LRQDRLARAAKHEAKSAALARRSRQWFGGFEHQVVLGLARLRAVGSA
jgi:hypothetical protein